MKVSFLIRIFLLLICFQSLFVLSEHYSQSLGWARSPAVEKRVAFSVITQMRQEARRQRFWNPRAHIAYAKLTKDQWWSYLSKSGASDSVLLDRAGWYLYDNFVAVAQKSPQYASFVKKHYEFYKKYEHKNGWFDSKEDYQLAQRFAQLSKEIYAQQFRDNYSSLQQFFTQEMKVGEENKDIFSSAHQDRLKKRVSAVRDMQEKGISYTVCSYQLSSECSKELRKFNADSAVCQECYGTQLQQVIHHECVLLLEETVTLPLSSTLSDHKAALFEWIDAAREFNQEGECAKAATIQDFCWSLLEYGKALVEGAVKGVVSAVEDCIKHPLTTAVYIIFPQGVLVYQLSKVLVNVADIGLTYVLDKEKGQRKLQGYSAPITQIIEAIKNKQISGPDVVRGATQFAVCWKAQSKLLAGLGKFYGTTKTRLERFIKKNQLAEPEQYLTTPEGMMLRETVGNGESIDQALPMSPSIVTNVLSNNDFNFTIATSRHMQESSRMIPVQILREIINYPLHVTKDPRGAADALMYYSRLWKNGQLYNVEVLYNKVKNQILHFKYEERALGPLERIK